MVPRNSQLILFETYIQHQQFLMTKNKISPSIKKLQRVEKPYSTTFRQISSKSDGPFSSYKN